MLGTDVGPVRIPGVVALNEDERRILRGIVDRVKTKRSPPDGRKLKCVLPE
ncbi:MULTISPECIES: hypothetical protein [Neorhizobium]|uniref:hypothetical protein n=1 Tax=Neorhizobium TaxID=1525371 RepID=UPI00155DF2BE|nr:MULTISPECIES: hypothetical protein [Neorhizobium]